MNQPRQVTGAIQQDTELRRLKARVASLEIRVECLEDEKQALTEQWVVREQKAMQTARSLYESQIDDLKQKAAAKEKEFNEKIREMREVSSAREKVLRQALCELKSKLALYTDGGPPRNKDESLAGDTLESGSKKSGQKPEEKDKKEPEKRKEGKNGGGRKLPGNLEEETVVSKLPREQTRCPNCGKIYCNMPHEESTKVDFRVVLRCVRHRREKRVESCNCKPGRVIHTAPKHLSAFDRHIWSDASAVEFALLKYHYQFPVTRILSMIHQSWPEASDTTIYRLLGEFAQILEDLESCIIHRNLQATFFQADETGLPVFVHREGYQSFYHTLWQVQGNDTVVYHFSSTRKANEIHEYFGEANRKESTLLVDRAAVYPTLAFTLAFCWAHVRRDFIKLGRYVKGNRGFALHWLRRIRKLYRLYKRRNSQSTDDDDEADQRLREHVATIHKELTDALKDKEKLPEERRKVLESLQRHWPGLIRFLDDLRVPLDNNDVERVFRYVANFRKACLGCRNDKYARYAARFFTVFGTLKHNGVALKPYLLAFLEDHARPQGKIGSIDDWMPWSMTDEVRNAIEAKRRTL